MVDEIREILNNFDPISLDEMDSVSLMDRTDTKFVFRIENLPAILNQLQTSYRVLEVNNSRLNRYESLYYDTPDFQMYLCHQNKRANRFKVRFRTYMESATSFFEIKIKNNKKRTIKERVRSKDIEPGISAKSEQFLVNKTHLSAKEIEPKLWVNYSRITLVNKTLPERLTIDVGLYFQNGDKQVHLDKLIIAELKQSKRNVSPFAQIMKEYHIRKFSISKYCIGVIFLFEHIKFNNFKRKIHILNKICYDKH